MQVPVIDTHGHLGSWPQYGWEDNLPGMVAEMDRAGVDALCVFHITLGEARRGNDVTAEAARRHPGRFVPFAFVTPHYPEEMVPELERCFDRLGMRGIKIYPPYVRIPVTAPEWEPVFAFAQERGVPVICHTGAGCSLGRPSFFVGLALKYPRVPWILGHSGGNREGRDEAIEAAAQAPNLFLETCSSHRGLGSIEQMVRGAGADRVLFGSDTPLFSPALQLGRVMTADLSPDEKALVLGGNAQRILLRAPAGCSGSPGRGCRGRRSS